MAISLRGLFGHNISGKVMCFLKKLVSVLLLFSAIFVAGVAWGDDSVSKKGVLMVSFGTTVPSGQKAIDNLFATLKSVCPDKEVRLAYTSNIIRRKLAKEENKMIDSPMIALSKMRDEGFTDVVVVSTHIIPGEEYGDLEEIVRAFQSIRGKYGFDRLVLSEPLLYHEEDFEAMAGFLDRTYGDKVDEDSVVVLMGHGTPDFANAAYGHLQTVLESSLPGFIVGTVEGAPTLDDVLLRLKAKGARKATLAPFMIVAGDHATNDMAGPEDDSWVTVIKGDGYRVSSVLKGLGEYDEIGAMLVRKYRAAAGDGF